ncbi:hypothetical protein N7499_000475 [Penicillium canescens]|uniref:Zn(2)-C6 fungal-type domain-containing protein n=1 Tax=Penicillium canescens TaxID=5083 RepID=A0AAD6IGX8_PENCN|nr:uncharacterized protein N7446_011322 [Penicillium canescens]KAJ6029329.1 hypothetical protein N7444_012316 [Penicillium canescens]KAJ6047760.1 hypothetical protein N7460_003907 [Penicillium canescens]KAJ6048639.1 hypothetical protein N7446_011322 [Penicillium canescens]KAJ6100845.1 hypothetical protein N7499_000475 [Penicillium canescens]KAJ6173306.1 hypothetical protein N7485_006118 [Penicillium canescens]
MSSSNESRPRVSRSCANCRAVRRRCDKQVPHCGQCIRTREVCAGYRDEWDLLFRDQTSHTVKRSKEIEAQKKSSAKTAATPPPACSLIPNIDEIGVNYFFDNFVAKGSSSCGYLNYISTISKSDGQHSTLVASMAAVGLVTLANAARQPKLVSHARVKYSEAIQRVNLALQSPVESLKDSILMSVISLGVFENVSNFASWARHVQGAAALLVARGKSQFTSTAAILMFNQVRADMTVACVHGNRPFPEELLELQEEATKHTAASSAFWILGVLATRHVNLLWKVRQNTAQIPWSHLLDEATVLQNDFEQVFGNLAVQEPYTTILEGGGDPDIIFNGRYDLYHSTWAIRVWNNTRMLQMIVCNIIYYLLTKALAMDLTPALRAHIKLRVEKTLEIQSKLESDMLATVPQALGYVSSAAQHHSSVDFTSPASVSGSYLLTWCLYTVGQSVVAKSKTRQWVIRHMQEIGKHAGIAMALQLVENIVTLDELRRAAGEDDGLREFRDVLSIQSEESKISGDSWVLSGTSSEISQSLG